MEYSREKYVNKLMERRDNGLIKVITGIKRSGKSYILNTLFRRRLIESGMNEEDIIMFSFDSDDDIDLLDRFFPEEDTRIVQKNGGYLVNSKKFRAFMKDVAGNRERLCILLDEVQLLENFIGTLNGLNKHEGYDIYVTGSNSRFLSADIATEFRGRGSVVHVLPLTFSEYMECSQSPQEAAWRDYIETGGIPIVAKMSSREERTEYLTLLCQETYLKDIVDRSHVGSPQALSDVLDVTASSIGTLVNPSRIADTFATVLRKGITDDTVSDYIGLLEDAFLISKAKRYDIRGRRYIGSPYKLYFEDIGIRNARLGFRQTEETHIMENIIYNELRYRGFSVDVGQMDVNVRTDRKDVNGRPIYEKRHLEIDFVASKAANRFYIQSALSMNPEEKAEHEKRPLREINDSFTKIVVTKNGLNAARDEDGILTVDLFDFLLGDWSSILM